MHRPKAKSCSPSANGKQTNPKYPIIDQIYQSEKVTLKNLPFSNSSVRIKVVLKRTYRKREWKKSQLKDFSFTKRSISLVTPIPIITLTVIETESGEEFGQYFVREVPLLGKVSPSLETWLMRVKKMSETLAKIIVGEAQKTIEQALNADEKFYSEPVDNGTYVNPKLWAEHLRELQNRRSVIGL